MLMDEPVIIEREESRVVGIGGNFISVLSPDHTNMPTIPELWDRYQQRSGEIAGRISNASLGVVSGVPAEQRTHDSELHYLAGAEVKSSEEIPEGMKAGLLPAGSYAKFTYRGHITRIGSAYGFIYGDWFPRSGYGRTSGPEFELYDERFRHDSDTSELDIYIPVVPA
ncbi:MAG: AraC family transcriptional regulator [Chlorobi bacterium]|nr:AraC family transcriptional regulator [Chlorobiota bacterium]